MTHSFKLDGPITLRIKNGDDFETLTVDADKMHESWIARCFEYGVRRLVNDSNSGAKGQDKVDGCKLSIKEMTNGDPMPDKPARSVSASVDPVTALAVKNAKAALTALFKQVTGMSKAIDFAKHEKVAPFFKVTDDRAVWEEGVVIKWMKAQAAAKKVDYMADAKALLDTTSDAAGELDF